MLVLHNVRMESSNVRKKIRKPPNVTKVLSHVMLKLHNMRMELSNERKNKGIAKYDKRIVICDGIIYSKSWNNLHVIISLYVNDMLIFCSDMHVIIETKNMFKSYFDMKDLGEANFILGMKITKKCDGIFLDQSHYVEKISRKYNFHDHKSVTTPFDSSVHLFPVNNDDEIFNKKRLC